MGKVDTTNKVASERNKLDLVKAYYDEAKTGWQSWYNVAQEDFRFSLGKQWDDADIKTLQKRKQPILTLNCIKRHVDLISGAERQNKSDLKAFPIEGSDDMISEMLSRVMKWVMSSGNNEYVPSTVFKDSLVCGLGWIHPYICYDFDPSDGDIVVKKIAPFDLWPDPHFSEPDLSDCDYIIRHKEISKDKAKVLYPDYADEISGLQGGVIKNDGIRQRPAVASDRGIKLLVVEYWHREYEMVTFVVNSDNAKDTVEWKGKPEALAAMLAENPNFEIIKRKMPRIKLTTVIDERLIVFDDDSPYGVRFYPFIPMFAFYDSSWSEWDEKLVGLVRALKDPQREKNKRRSQIMAAINTMPHSGFFAPKGSVDDLNQLRNSSGAGKIIEYNAVKGKPESIRPPDLPTSIMQLEMMFADDMNKIGANPEMQGEQQGKNDPLGLVQMRAKQGMTAMQEPFDNRAYALKLLGRQLIHLITSNFSREKIERILGDDLPFKKLMEEGQMQLQDIVTEIKQLEMQKPHTQGLVPENEEEAAGIIGAAQQGEQIDAQMQELTAEAQQVEMQLESVKKLEEDFWSDFDAVRDRPGYDCVVDEVANSPTYRIAGMQALIQAAQYGVQVPPESIVEMMEIPKAQKEKINEYAQMQQQAAAAAQQQEQQLQMAKLQVQVKQQTPQPPQGVPGA